MQKNYNPSSIKQKANKEQQTEAILDAEHFLPHSKVPIPSEECVEEAKEWVDENEK